MAARSLGSLYIDIEARTAKLETDLGKAKQKIADLGKSTQAMSAGFTKAFSLAKAAIGAFISVQALKGLETMSMGTLEALSAQMKLAAQTGLTVDTVKAYQMASEHLGVTNLDLAKTMRALFKLQSDGLAGTRLAGKEIAQLGFTVSDFAALNPDELFERSVQGLHNLGNVSQRTALQTKIFGKEALNTSNLVTQGTDAITKARAEMEKYGETLSETDQAKITVALRAVTELDHRWESFKKGLAVGLTPLIYTAATRLADFIQSIDIDELANKISGYVLAISGFILTIPERLTVLLDQVSLKWYSFMAQFDTGDGDSLMGKIFGSQADNQKKVGELTNEISVLTAGIGVMTDSMAEEFKAKVQEILDRFRTMPAVVSGVSDSLSRGSIEMVHQFATSFEKIADFSDQFIDGESMKFGDFLRDMIKMIVKTFLKVSLINPMLNGIFGSMMGGTSAGWWSNLPSMFGGGKAVGGPVIAGSTHLVGEHGPEVVNFGASANITPNDRMANYSGSSSSNQPSIVINQSFTSGMQKSELGAVATQIMQQTKAAVADAVMRGGGYRRAFSR